MERRRKLLKSLSAALQIMQSLHRMGSPIGPLFTYCFTQTGIGVGVSILCTKCKDKKDITDYDKW